MQIAPTGDAAPPPPRFPQKPRKPRFLIQHVIFDGWDFGIKFSYFEGIGEALRGSGGFFIREKDHPRYRYWAFRGHVIEGKGEAIFANLIAASDGAVTGGYPAIQRILNRARENPDPHAFLWGLTEKLYPLRDGSVGIAGGYHSGIVSLVKSMNGSYLPPMKAWKLPGTSPQVLKSNLLSEIQLTDDQVIVMDGVYDLVETTFEPVLEPENGGIHVGPATPVVPVPGAEHGEQEVMLPGLLGITPSPFSRERIDAALMVFTTEALLDFQREGVHHLASKTSAALFDDMGLGKTRQAIVAAYVITGGKECVLIACPKSLREQWRREILKMVPDAVIAVGMYDEEANWCILNYERLGEVVECADKFRVMLMDEAHYLKEAEALRTQVAFEVAAKIEYRYLLTGTPILNRESELHTLLRLSGHPVGNMEMAEFRAAFSGNSHFRAALNKQLTNWMLRRKKSMVLKELKGKQVQPLPVATELAAYMKLLTAASNPLRKLQKLRGELERAKREIVVEMVTETGGEDKVIVYCERIDSVKWLLGQFKKLGIKALAMTGQTAEEDRQKVVDQFQDDPEVRVLIGTKVLELGWNLFAANYVIFNTIPWTPALKEQIEDRAYRKGQTRLVVVKVPIVKDTIDEDFWQLLLFKQSVVDDVLNPRNVEKAMKREMAAIVEEKAKRISLSATPTYTIH